MAIMIPKDIDISETLSDGEKKVFYLLKNQLNDDWIVLYSVRWATGTDEFAYTSQGECDFIIMNENYGILIIEVKGGIVNCINGEWSSISRNNIKNYIKDPLKQADKSKFVFLSKFKKEKIAAYITTAVCFPDSKLNKMNLPLDMPKEVIIDEENLNDIENKLISIFKFRASKDNFTINKVSMSDFNKAQQIMMPKVTSEITLESRIENLNFKYIKLNEEQLMCFEQLEDNRFISIKGHAGTGKTVLALKKALKDSEEGREVLYVCYNNLLFEKIKQESEGRFEVWNIHGFAEEYLKNNAYDCYSEFNETGDYDKMMSDYIRISSENKNTNKKYDLILVDEGQDFHEDWFSSLYNFIEEENSCLYVFYDEFQMLYEKFGHTDISFLQLETKYTLKRNMRNTDEICRTSLNILGIDEKTEKVRLKGIKGINPEIIIADSSFDVNDKLKNTIMNLKKNNLKDENITILLIDPKKKAKYIQIVKVYSEILVESVRKYKGLENDIIIIPDLDCNFLKDDEVRKLLYVAVSRAKVHVILIINTESINRNQTREFKKRLSEIIYKK